MTEDMMYFYDLYISIGEDCRPAHYLCQNDLRNKAYPLDWMWKYSLHTVYHLFEVEFKDFFDVIEEFSDKNVITPHRHVVDVQNHITSIHHFKEELVLEEAQQDFKKKMNKRFVELKKDMSKAKRIILVCDRNDTTEALKEFLAQFSMLIHNMAPMCLEIALLNIRNDSQMNSDKCFYNRYQFQNKDIRLRLEEYCINDTFDSITKQNFGWVGNEKMWNEILYNYFNSKNFIAMKEFKSEVETLIIYGAGANCRKLINKFRKYNIEVDGIAVSEPENNPRCVEGVRVDRIKAYSNKSCIVISLANKEEVDKLEKQLKMEEYYNLYKVDDFMAIKKI